jgi:hypothetical protein
LWSLIASLIPVWYLFFARRIRIKKLIATFVLGAIAYIVWFSIIKDSLLGPWFVILIFNLLVIFALLFFFLALIATLGHRIFHMLKWHTENSMHDVFLKTTVGLIAFCLINILLLAFNVYFGVVVRLEFALWVFLLRKQRDYVAKLGHIIEWFAQSVHSTLSKLPLVSILYYVLIVVTCMYIYAGLNLAYIPYPTAWDANHAYIFFPKAWAIHNGIYWGASGANSLPYLWNGFLAFWFKLASSFPTSAWLFGIAPDTLTVIMNFWSWPLILLASWFLLHAFLEFLQSKHLMKKQSIQYTMTILCVWWILMILWLTSGMGAFLLFVDNKTDLAVMFFSVIALYVGIQFIRYLQAHIAEPTHTSHKITIQYAILAWLFFAAAAIAKPTGMFDIIHFAVLFLLQWNSLFLALGIYTMIIGLLGKSQLLLVHQFVTVSQAMYLIIIGFLIMLVPLVKAIAKKTYRVYIRYFLYRALTILATFVIFKWPFVFLQQWFNGNVNVPQWLKSILLWQAHLPQTPRVLLAANVSVDSLKATAVADSGVAPKSAEVTKAQCVASVPSDTSILYKNLKKVPEDGGSEDLGRYIWYGQKSFNNIWILSWLPEWCYSIYADARALCWNNEISLSSTAEQALATLAKMPQTPKIVEWQEKLTGTTDLLAQKTIIKAIATYIESNTIKKTSDAIYVPYKLLVPFNVTFNWSLQNLSSYYTDIGFVWLLGLGLVLLWLLYWFLLNKKALIRISLITLWAWAARWVVGSAIIWYSLGLIIWTILAALAYIHYLFDPNEKKSPIDTILLYSIAWLLILWSVLQLILNMIRISTQWGNWPFVWYKSNVGTTYQINEQLVGEEKTKIWYNAQDVFSLQFPHYTTSINTINNRAADQWVVVAGTYLQYFINNQRNVRNDGFLTTFWENASDNNVCNTYQRLVDKKIKFLVIDPNIASVVMGAGNNTLFDRFFAQLSPSGSLVQHGTLTMLQALTQQWYLSLSNTNNIVTKYAFVASDVQLAPLLQVAPGEQLLLERARMSAARFFANAQIYGNAAASLFVSRLGTYEAIQDLADIVGKEIRSDKVIQAAQSVRSGAAKQDYAAMQVMMKELTNDERFVLQQYLSLVQAQQQNPTQLRQYVTTLISQSVNNGSQLIVLTVE